MKRLLFYFDYASPFAYLGSTQVQRVAREHNAELIYKPFLLGGLFKAIGTPLVPIATYPEAKRKYAWDDMQRWAAHWGVKLKWPTGFPLNTLSALRLSLVANSPELVNAIMHAVWVEDRLPNEETLRACCCSVGIDEGLLDRVAEPEVKAQLRDATQEAIDRGVPGVPSFVIGDKLFWGQDRFLFVEKALDA